MKQKNYEIHRNIISKTSELLEKYKNYFLAALYLILSLVATKQFIRLKDPILALYFVRDFIVMIYFLKRKEAYFVEGGIYSIISTLSLFSPIFYIKKTDYLISNNMFSLYYILRYIGVVTVIIATLTLGKNLGIRPAYRGEYIKYGIYRHISHPMYLGYIIFQSSYILLNHYNLLIFTISCLLFYLRAKKETQIIKRFT